MGSLSSRLARRVQPAARAHRGARARTGRHRLGHRRARVHRLHDGLGVGDPRPRPPGDRRGRPPPRRARLELRLSHRRLARARGRAGARGPVRRAPALLRLGHRGHRVRGAARARLHGAIARPEVRGRVSRRERGRHRQPVPAPSPRVPPGRAHVGRCPGERRRRRARGAVQRPSRDHRDPHRPSSRRRGRDRRATASLHAAPARVPRGSARARGRARGALDLRRDRDGLPPGVRRRSGVLRRAPGPGHLRQGARWRLSDRRGRRPRRRPRSRQRGSTR